MIPRLQPRPATKRPSGIENIFPANANVKIPPVDSSTSNLDSASASRSDCSNGFPLPSYNSIDDLSSEKGIPFSKSPLYMENAPLSPLQPTQVQAPTPATSEPAISPVPNHYGNQHRHLLLNYSSSTSVSFDTDTSCCSGSYCSDFSLTPPGSRPHLLVSAKRYGSEVRRQHSKRRRRRRRPSSTSSDSQKKSSGSGADADAILTIGRRAGTDIGKDSDDDALCLWKDEEDPFRPMKAGIDCSDGTEGENLPLLASSDEEEERTDRIEEIVRAQHLQQAKLARERDKLQPNIALKSILKSNRDRDRDQPPKGCLSNAKPKRPRNQTPRYKTPPTSPEDLEVSSQAKEQQPRRVQFGVPSAVEYEVDRPPGHLTPMSQEVIKKRYSMDPKESTHEEEKMTKETKENNMILSEWEDQLSIGEANRSENNNTSDRTRGKSGSSTKRSRKNRRSSSIFSPASRMSLDYDDTNERNCDTSEDKLDATHSTCSLAAATSASTASPSMMVAKDLASLSMSPSNTSSEKRKHTNKCMVTNTTPMPSADEQRTWDFVADLGSINSKGASELSPQLRPGVIQSTGNSSGASSANNTLMISEKNTPPPTNINLDTIHSFGAAAFDNDVNSESSPSHCVDISRLESPSNILKILIETPSLDQEFDFPSVLRNLSLLRMREESADLDRCITAIFPCFDSALSCTKGLVEQEMLMPLSKSTYRTNHVSERSLATAKKTIMTEWNENETTLMEKLANMLGIEKTNILEAERKCKKITCLQSQNELIEEEIFKLENNIRQQKRALDLLDASIAPCASILCQATVHMGIHGFSFEEFRDDNILKLNFFHAVYGIQTSVIFNINSQPRTVVETDYDASNTYNCPIFEFHRAFLNMLVSGKIPIQFDSAELQESLLTIGQFLGRLDQSAMELEKRKASDIDLSDEETKEKIKKFVLGQASFPPF